MGKRIVVVCCAGILLATLPVLAKQSQTQKKSGGWRQLFNGKDLTGWKHVGPGGDTVEDSLIRTNGGMGLLFLTGGKIAHCRICIVYKMRAHHSNSGGFIRISVQT